MVTVRWRSPVEDDFKTALLNEYKHVVAKLSEANSITKQLSPKHDSLAKLIETYGWLPEIEKLEPDDDIKGNPEAAKTKGLKIAQIAKEFFEANNNQWTPLSDLFVHMNGRGVRVGGKNPNSTLSAHLSNSEWFESDRTRGWRLKSEFAPQPARGSSRVACFESPSGLFMPVPARPSPAPAASLPTQGGPSGGPTNSARTALLRPL